ncbi:NACHT domain-containing protein [Phormidium tenue]|uniref:NACHT domain-containing NTPase n=1 Tax=Phormidium tenue FACHB-1050 TaxID=2692857 RepID=A0ABR8CC04_9CYAN|nr:NACHT domain-containing NTPase [Phormidium tenue]MBD2318267.1 NACHT domain-containing NTPase [Phormidium tenue FACHB-1050]
MARSLRASQKDISNIKKAMRREKYTQQLLAEQLKISRSTITALFAGKPIDKNNFNEICEYLGLREIRGEEAVSDDLDLLVKEVKQKIAADVTDRCGTMRVLDMTQPVDLDRIYTDVNIIKDVIGRRRIGYDEVMEVCTREHFDRFLVGTIKERVAGFEAVEEFQKLVVLGKPGAGKTTFMKYLAMSCLSGRFHGELVPIFVTLKAYAEERGQPTLENYILNEFQQLKVSQDVVQCLLENGKALILLDGLDEIKDEHDYQVKQDIKKFSTRWLKNRFVITSRIPARANEFETFTDVEVSDFDNEQIETFINQWFLKKNKTEAKILIEQLKYNQPVKELAKTPLLLTLICYLYGQRQNLPVKLSELYKEGVEVLMKTWGSERKVKGEEIYKNFSLQNKQSMLGKIAFSAFENSEYFLHKDTLQKQIEDMFNLSNSDYSEVILEAIEYHHGLLVTRAKNIYSFSHLTFQEYFTAREIEQKQKFEMLVQHITDPRWRHVILLTVELRQSDDILRLMKKQIDEMLAVNEKFQCFLLWLQQKTNSVHTRYKHVAVRAYYADAVVCAYELPYALDYGLEIDFTYDLNLDIDIDIDLKLILDIHLIHTLEILFNIDSNLKSVLEIAFKLSLNLNNNIFSEIFFEIEFYLKLAHEIALELSCKANIADTELQQLVQTVKDELPSPINDLKIYLQWWQTNGREWVQKFRHVCIKHRNIGHDWQFTKEQVELLKKYYAANLLLVECMNRSYVSKQVREEIESTMLLPSKK